MAVYDETIISVKNHHIPATILVDTALKTELNVTIMGVQVLGFYIGAISDPCCIKLPIVNQNEFLRLNWFVKNSGSSMHAKGFVHSSGDMRPIMNNDTDTMR